MKKIILTFTFVLMICASSFAQITDSALQIVLEKFCKECYNDCFTGRKYLDGSLTVTSVEWSGTSVKVKGRHNFIGYLGKTHTDIDFKADITYDGTDVVVIFYKWFVPVIDIIDGHWESCKKRIQIN